MAISFETRAQKHKHMCLFILWLRARHTLQAAHYAERPMTHSLTQKFIRIFFSLVLVKKNFAHFEWDLNQKNMDEWNIKILCKPYRDCTWMVHHRHSRRQSPAETTLAQEGTTQGLLVCQGGTEHLSWWRRHPNSRFTCLKLNPYAAVWWS